jgi:hypothetical protein
MDKGDKLFTILDLKDVYDPSALRLPISIYLLVGVYFYREKQAYMWTVLSQGFQDKPPPVCQGIRKRFEGASE